MFLVMSEIDFVSYEDQNTPYAVADGIENVITKLKMI